MGIISSAGVKEAESAVAAAKSAFPALAGHSSGKKSRISFQSSGFGPAQALANSRRSRSLKSASHGAKRMPMFAKQSITLNITAGRCSGTAIPQRWETCWVKRAICCYEPRGVAVVIAPWNFPMAISTGMSSAAIVTGNTVVYKPASQSPVIGYMLARIFEEAGLPEGVFNFVPGPGGSNGRHPDRTSRRRSWSHLRAAGTWAFIFLQRPTKSGRDSSSV